MKNLSDYIKEDGIAPSIGAESAASEFATPGNTTGMGNSVAPSTDKPGSGDRFDDEKTAKALKEKFRKRKKKKKCCTKDEEEQTD